MPVPSWKFLFTLSSPAKLQTFQCTLCQRHVFFTTKSKATNSRKNKHMAFQLNEFWNPLSLLLLSVAFQRIDWHCNLFCSNGVFHLSSSFPSISVIVMKWFLWWTKKPFLQLARTTRSTPWKYKSFKTKIVAACCVYIKRMESWWLFLDLKSYTKLAKL